MPKCEPLKITATLLDGRLNSANGIIMLDSILYHAWFIKYAPQVLGGEYDEKYIHETQKYIGLPLVINGMLHNQHQAGVYNKSDIIRELRKYCDTNSIIRPDSFIKMCRKTTSLQG
jgi:hypothetical protein